MDAPDLFFRRITARNVIEVCGLSDTLRSGHRKMVADNSLSIAQAHCSENTWMRAIYTGETPVGFLMLHIGADFDDGINCPGVFLWRLMIAGPFQRKGYGRRAMNLLFAQLRAQGVSELYTSCALGEFSPEGFYKKLGFVPTGGMYGDEIELLLSIP